MKIGAKLRPAADAGDSGPGFGQRFRAWWNGDSLPGGQPSGGKKPASAAPAKEPVAKGPKPVPAPEAGAEIWSARRIATVQKLWGEGFLGPGGPDYVVQLVTPFGLNPAMSLLDFGAGLGGAARAIANECGVYVTGMEPDPALAKAGHALSEEKGMRKMAPVEAYDPTAIDEKTFRRGMYDCAFSDGMLYTIADKKALLTAIVSSLKSDGQLLFTDFMYDGASPSPALEAWALEEPGQVYPWSLKSLRDCLQGLNIDVRIELDDSENYRELIIAGLDHFLTRTDADTLDSSYAYPLGLESDIWARRLAVLQSGDLRYYRIHGLKMA